MPLSKKPNTRNQIESIRAAGIIRVRQITDIVAKKHSDIVQPWEQSSHKPKFSTEIKETKKRVTGRVKMTAKAAVANPYSVWQLLNYGTQVRYMQVSILFWESKTQPRVLESGPGFGFRYGIDTERPRPGIEAREWADEVGIQTKPDADINIREGWSSGFRRAFK